MRAAPNKLPVANRSLYIIEERHAPDYTLPKVIVTAEVGRHIHFDIAALESFDVKGCGSLHYDLLLLCAAIEFADRSLKRPRNWRRILDVSVPVIDIATWKKPEVLKSLHRVLNYLTGDAWKFTFYKAKNSSPIGSRQALLDFGNAPKSFAVAYSDGLDSRAVSALSGEKEALCIRLAANRQLRKNGDSYFTQIPFKVKGFRSNESSFRSRGFQFAAVTAIAAQLSGFSRVIVPESGQGALGPALLPLHNVHPDYRNHPTFFRKMEHFIKALLGHQTQFEQPRLWSTKGETLLAFLNIPGKSSNHLTSTRSCWQTRRVVNDRKRKQCGLCAACLLRRLSLHAAGVIEPIDTYVVSDLAASEVNNVLSTVPLEPDRRLMIEYGSVGARHLQHLADMSSLPDDDLRVHASEIAAATGEAYEETLRKLRKMLIKHAEEWRAFLFAQGEQSFLKSWMDGGRHGRPK